MTRKFTEWGSVDGQPARMVPGPVGRKGFSFGSLARWFKQFCLLRHALKFCEPPRVEMQRPSRQPATARRALSRPCFLFFAPHHPDHRGRSRTPYEDKTRSGQSTEVRRYPVQASRYPTCWTAREVPALAPFARSMPMARCPPKSMVTPPAGGPPPPSAAPTAPRPMCPGPTSDAAPGFRSGERRDQRHSSGSRRACGETGRNLLRPATCL